MSAALALADPWLRPYPMPALSDFEDDPPHYRAPMPNEQDDRRESLTTPAPPPSVEPKTSPEANERPAIAPPGRLPDLPDDKELASSALASTELPEWFMGSFIGQALTKFSDDAKAIRAGRDQQHGEQMRALQALGGKLGRFGERIASLETDQRRLSRQVEQVQAYQERQSDEHGQERREIRSLLTMALLRLEILENHHQGEALKGVRVLIVEDEPMLAKTLHRMLTRDGAVVYAASSWEETQAIVADQKVDFGLLDVRLGGEDGIQLAEWLLVKTGMARQRIVLMTGYMDRAHNDLADELGLRVVSKPFGGDDLVRIIREGLDVSPGTAEAPTTA